MRKKLLERAGEVLEADVHGLVLRDGFVEVRGAQAIHLAAPRSGLQWQRDRTHRPLARSAWRKYGKGRHPAALNFGDCFAYALAKSSSEPLLAKGGEFALTDVAIQTL